MRASLIVDEAVRRKHLDSAGGAVLGCAMRTSRAVVQTAPRRLELRELPVPDIDDDSALLRVEACGICGSDAGQYAGVRPVRLPVVPGHEPLGVIERIGERAAKRWGVDVGDRVAVESIIRCGHCRACIGGRYQLCRGRGGLFGHGYVPLDRPPGLWGAYADYMYLDPLSIVHRVREDIPASLAVMFNPLGAGFRWAVEIPATGPGDSVLVLGPGQRGLASVIAARAAGADTIIVTGLSRDARQLAPAREDAHARLPARGRRAGDPDPRRRAARRGEHPLLPRAVVRCAWRPWRPTKGWLTNGSSGRRSGHERTREFTLGRRSYECAAALA